MNLVGRTLKTFLVLTHKLKKVKVAHTQLPSVEFRSLSRFLAVNLQVTWVIHPTVSCHYFPPGLQLPLQHLRGLLQFRCLMNRGTMGVNSLPKTVTWQRRDCDSNPGPSAPESSMLTTWLPSHPTHNLHQRINNTNSSELITENSHLKRLCKSGKQWKNTEKIK